ncbi:DUF2846 domain-containing protein [Sphingomonas sp. ABOLE]|uniref:DUF2846 domain-containing protein n=1 Tax=Sphingomonas sp. ABOLE TaxID=1985878 RepID=UPI0019D0B7C7|nr:DUF2846 domain-containing protein [Sphingomonas sp. ABOLE]
MLLPYLATALLSALGQDAAPAVQERGTIILYRPESIMGAAVACPIRYKGDVLVELGRGKYAEWSVPKGKYTLENKVSSVDVTVEAGEKRYVRCSIKMGFMAGRASLQLVDQADFDKHGKDFEKKDVAAIDPAP